ncbi:MAG: ABC transporter permease subunit [Gilliamella sp.]|uniref:ABC transporter permease subunit n=1 Tax=Gilliamella sp. TaxID=1891236 RepID=UPI0025CEAD0E|nr:ABC transporter permease subunit [Gilliamella sp.]MCO6544646.1 ABC transporter permease subunit [Gilliamella sp.]MCO6546408.1 ABC transporter permease subunit [Gilliamella sp.]
MSRQARLLKNVNLSFNRLHSNLYLIVGFYGILAISFVSLSTKWFFHAHLNPIYPTSLPPAWWSNGDINHILGTNAKGQDIFGYLLIGYRSTMSMTLKAVFYVAVIGGLINYLMFFISFIRPFILFVFKFCMVVPPLLGVIVISLLLEDDITNILLVIGLSYTPRFIYNIHQRAINEWNKTYITAYRLDGLSSLAIFNHYILPNILPIYLTEIVSLFGSIILAITTITFLGFANDISRPDLGMMMFQMKDIIATNYLAFLSPGIAVSATIILVYLFNFGLYGRRAGT